MKNAENQENTRISGNKVDDMASKQPIVRRSIRSVNWDQVRYEKP